MQTIKHVVDLETGLSGEYILKWMIPATPSLDIYSLNSRRPIGIAIPTINLRRFSDRPRFITGIPLTVRRGPFVNSGHAEHRNNLCSLVLNIASMV